MRLPRGARFAITLALLGAVMFVIPPPAAALLGLLLVLGALVASGPNPAEPIKAFGRLIYGG